MKFLLRLLLQVVANAAGLYAAAYFIQGFSVTGNAVTFIELGAILTALNVVVRPILKLFAGPFIVLTLGFFMVIVNALMLVLLDFLSNALTIQWYIPLLIGTLLVSAVNIVFHLGERLLGIKS